MVTYLFIAKHKLATKPTQRHRRPQGPKLSQGTLTQAGDKVKGMAGGPGDPVALLRLYMRHGKLAEAGNLAQTYLRCWLREVSP